MILIGLGAATTATLSAATGFASTAAATGFGSIGTQSTSAGGATAKPVSATSALSGKKQSLNNTENR